MSTRLSIAGERYGRLEAIKRTSADCHGKSLWLFRCDCGNVTERVASRVLSGRISSCGCLRAETAASTSRKTAAARGRAITRHGHATRGARSSEYMIWAQIIDRCTNSKSKAYPNYGGRGITVCPEWAASFDAFFSGMGARPGVEFSIDRIDNDGPYSPGNCRWATRVEQKANQRPRKDAVYLTHNGETRTRDDWARRIGIKYSTLVERLRRNWPVDRALTP